MKLPAIGLASIVLGATLIAGSNPAFAATTCVEGVIPSFLNGSYELPDFAPSNYLETGAGNGWQSTDITGVIELWGNGKEGLTAYQGRQWLALESYNDASVFQDFATTPGQVLNWSLVHRDRYSNGTATFTLKMGTSGNMVDQTTSVVTGQTWTARSGSYTVPAGQTTTRFEMVSDAGSITNRGDNMIDAVVVTTQICTEDPALANTGSNSQDLLPLGIAFSVVGALLIALRRRQLH